MPLQAARQFGHECAIQGRVGASHVGNRQDQVFGILLGGLHQPIGPGGGGVPAHAVAGDEGGHAAQVLNERQAQHDGQRPQFAESQRGHHLVGGHEAAETLGIDAPIAV